MAMDKELKYTQADLDFFSDNADEYFNMMNEYRALLVAIVESDDAKRRAWQSGQHATISRWIPTEEAIEAARKKLGRK